jgi:hypothetical protein
LQKQIWPKKSKRYFPKERRARNMKYSKISN